MRGSSIVDVEGGFPERIGVVSTLLHASTAAGRTSGGIALVQVQVCGASAGSMLCSRWGSVSGWWVMLVIGIAAAVIVRIDISLLDGARWDRRLLQLLTYLLNVQCRFL